MKDKSSRHIFGSFFLGQKEYAVDVNNIREVVNAPGSYTPVPLAPPYMMGMFNLRGMIIPVINLHSILETKNESNLSEAKIAIIECDGFCLGFLFDQTAEILGVKENEICHLSYRSSGSVIEASCSSFLKLQAGQKIIQILDPSKLLAHDTLGEFKKSQLNDSRENLLKMRRGARKKCIMFSAGHSHLALPIESIQEIIKIQNIEQSTVSYKNSPGMIHLREKVVPVIDLAGFLGEPNLEITEDSRIIILNAGEGSYGLVVSNVDSIVSYFQDEVIPFPMLSKGKKDLFNGCLTKEEKSEVLLMNHSVLNTDKEILDMVAGYISMFRTGEDKQKNKLRSLIKKTYITFHLDYLYALEIKTFKEIVELPKDLINPPNLPQMYKGVMNLRGELILIVDTRSVYKLRDCDADIIQNILIFEREGEKIGLLVDSVNDILVVNDYDDVLKTQRSEPIKEDKNDIIWRDVLETLHIKTKTIQKTLMVLNIDQIWKRVQVGQKKVA